MLYLQELAKQGQQIKTLTLNDRLPHFIRAPSELRVAYQVEAKDDFYLIHLHANGLLHLQCQRCLDEFDFPYENATVVAVCRDEVRAETLLEHYECVVSASLQISLDDLIIDELHLYAPQFHTEIEECSKEVNQFLSEKNESS